MPETSCYGRVKSPLAVAIEKIEDEGAKLTSFTTDREKFEFVATVTHEGKTATARSMRASEAVRAALFSAKLKPASVAVGDIVRATLCGYKDPFLVKVEGVKSVYSFDATDYFQGEVLNQVRFANDAIAYSPGNSVRGSRWKTLEVVGKAG